MHKCHRRQASLRTACKTRARRGGRHSGSSTAQLCSRKGQITLTQPVSPAGQQHIRAQQMVPRCAVGNCKQCINRAAGEYELAAQRALPILKKLMECQETKRAENHCLSRSCTRTAPAPPLHDSGENSPQLQGSPAFQKTSVRFKVLHGMRFPPQLRPTPS